MTAPGLEPFTAAELAALGLAPAAPEPGGVPFTGGATELYRANLRLRTASRVLLRLAEFGARALGELERKAGELDWAGILPAGVPARLRVTSRKSRLYHQGAIAERIGTAIQAAGRVVAPRGGGEAAEEDETGAGEQLIIVRLLRDRCSISLDTSGALLHRRGYRQWTGKAPLRETLAAALLMASDWDPETPLIDPFAGSGTIPIEAALLARRIVPGRHRRFAFEQWPSFDHALWAQLLAEADLESRPAAPAPILGADRDAGAVSGARENAARAGVADDIEFRQAALSRLEPPAGPGALVTNPPYGVRVGRGHSPRDLFARLGQVARDRLPDWTLTLLVPGEPLERQTGLDFVERFRTSNGGLPVRAVTGRATAPDSR